MIDINQFQNDTGRSKSFPSIVVLSMNLERLVIVGFSFTLISATGVSTDSEDSFRPSENLGIAASEFLFLRLLEKVHS